jgi:hypothetical protein
MEIAIVRKEVQDAWSKRVANYVSRSVLPTCIAVLARPDLTLQI